jgi:hypothetical protein
MFLQNDYTHPNSTRHQHHPARSIAPMNHHKTLKQVGISHGNKSSYLVGGDTTAGFFNISVNFGLQKV